MADLEKSFDGFMNEYANALKAFFRKEENQKKVSLNRGIPSELIRELQNHRPLRTFMPASAGGFGGHVHQSLRMLEVSSRESLSLSLVMGINGALFIQPVQKYAQKEVSLSILQKFRSGTVMGGLMITEPGYGSDALHMRSSYTKSHRGYHVTGIKHWGGLTGWADYWLLTAREKKADGTLARDIDFFIHDAANPGLEVEEYYENLGLYMLPYGRNRLNALIPESMRLIPQSTGIKMMLDTLHRSRMQFPGMAAGFIRRLLDEAMAHCRKRQVGGKSLFSYDQVRDRIARIQSCFTACSAMCIYASEHVSVKKDLSLDDIPANAIKTVITDMMQHVAQSYLQLTGAKGYRLDHLAGRSVVDSRPFQIFEGSNDILYQQIAESFLKKMKKLKTPVLHDFLVQYELTDKISGYLKNDTRFRLDSNLAQRKLVLLGKMLGKTVIANMILNMADRGYSADHVQNSMEILLGDIRNLTASVCHNSITDAALNRDQEHEWYQFLAI